MLRALVLGIVQGLTEFLPISSSAHLSIIPRLLGYRGPDLAFDVLLHFATLAAVVAYFARDLAALALSVVAPGRLGRREAAARRRLLALLALASVPTAVAGYLLQDWADGQTSRPLRAAVWLIGTTSLLIGAELYARRRTRRARQAAGPARPAAAGMATSPVANPSSLDERRVVLDVRSARRPRSGRSHVAASGPTADGEEELTHLPAGKALGIGLAQALALVPGTSRSGITIAVGLFQGVSRETAARFSFLLALPAILGAGILELGDLSQAVESIPELAVGFLAGAISGFFAISTLIRLLRTHTLWPFIWYRLVAGGLFVILLVRVRP